MQGYLHGCCVRLAREQHLIDVEQTQGFLSRALSLGQTADYSAAWFEGFLTHQALLLIHEQRSLGYGEPMGQSITRAAIH